MPPKTKFTKEEILLSALQLVRESGMQALTARALAERLQASVKPIFGLFESMQALREAVLERALEIHISFLKAEMEKGEYLPYKASGMAYIRFAQEEKELFRLLFMRDRSDEAIPESDEESGMMHEIIMRANGISLESAKRMHFEMWAFVHGFAAMLATGFQPVPLSDVSDMLTDVYTALRQKFIQEEREGRGK